MKPYKKNLRFVRKISLLIMFSYIDKIVGIMKNPNEIKSNRDYYWYLLSRKSYVSKETDDHLWC